MGVQRHTVPHFKGLINAKVDLEAQGRDTTFTLCHAQVQGAILLLKIANRPVFKFGDCIQWCSEQTGQVLFIGVKWPFSKGRGRR